MQLLSISCVTWDIFPQMDDFKTAASHTITRVELSYGWVGIFTGYVL